MKLRTILLGLLMVSVSVISTGCATSLTNMTQTRVLEPGQVQGSIGFQTDIHTKTISGFADAAKIAADQVTDGSGEISEETFRRALDAALLYKFFPISSSPEVIGRFGVWDGLLEGVDVGIRYNGSVIKGDVRVGLYESPDRAWVVTAQLGYGRQGSVASSSIEWLTLTEMSRNDFDFAVSAGWEYPEIFKAYVAPRVLISTISSKPKLSQSVRDRLPESLKGLDPHQFFPSTSMVYYGANTGFLVGYKYVFLNIDLSVFRIDFQPVVINDVRDYGGWVIAPTIGVTGFLN